MCCVFFQKSLLYKVINWFSLQTMCALSPWVWKSPAEPLTGVHRTLMTLPAKSEGQTVFTTPFIICMLCYDRLCALILASTYFLWPGVNILKVVKMMLKSNYKLILDLVWLLCMLFSFFSFFFFHSWLLFLFTCDCLFLFPWIDILKK